MQQDYESKTMEDLLKDLTRVSAAYFHTIRREIDHVCQSNRDENFAYSLKKIAAVSNSLEEHINLCKDLSRMEHSDYLLKPVRLNFVDILKEVNEKLNFEAKQSSILISYFHNEGNLSWDSDIPIYGERILLRKLLYNLCLNALEAAPNGSEIIIALDTQSIRKLLKISIHNFGIVPKEIHGNFFEKYYSYGKIGHAGFGTYEARLICRIHNGRIGFSSDDHIGTKVELELPELQNFPNPH